MNTNDIVKQSEISISVGLNNEKHPVKIEWSAQDSGLDGKKEAKALMLAFWDKKDNKETLVIATHGFIKKVDKVPANEINRAEKLRDKYLLNNNKQL